MARKSTKQGRGRGSHTRAKRKVKPRHAKHAKKRVVKHVHHEKHIARHHARAHAVKKAQPKRARTPAKEKRQRAAAPPRVPKQKHVQKQEQHSKPVLHKNEEKQLLPQPGNRREEQESTTEKAVEQKTQEAAPAPHHTAVRVHSKPQKPAAEAPSAVEHHKHPLHINEGMLIRDNLFESPEENSTRQGFGDELVELAKMNKEIVVLTADLAESTKTDAFKKAFPERFFNVGIAEQNLLAISAGLAFSGKIPFAASFGVFATGRAWDQLRTSICYARANVKIVATHCGITVGPDGPTHQSLSDLAVTRSIPNLIILSPCDYEQTRKAVVAASEINGPVYIRLGRPKLVQVTTRDTPFHLGRADFYASGKDVVIIATGSLVYEALLAAKKLGEKGISAGVLNVHTIKPIDSDAIGEAAQARLIVTAEDHHVIGGLGGAVAEVLSALPHGRKPRQLMIGVGDFFGTSGEAEELMQRFHLTSDDIVEAVLKEFNKDESVQNE